MHLYFSGIKGPFPEGQVTERTRFDCDGGMIGRASDCALVLDDGERHVSRQHAHIETTDSQFYLTVVSEINPVVINGTQHSYNEKVLLNDDDTIEIGPFVLHTHIVTASVQPAPPKLAVVEPPATADVSHALHCLGQGMKHPMRLSKDISADAFLRQYGEVMVELLEGVRKLTQLRAESKSEFVPTDRTMVAKVDTNPIKHAATRQELLKMMFPEQNVKGLIDPVESVREVVADLKVHDAAMQAGMRSAMQAILSELDPAKMEPETSGVLFNLFAGNALKAYKQRYTELREAIGRGKASDVWDAFREGYRAEVGLQKAKGNPGNRA